MRDTWATSAADGVPVEVHHLGGSGRPAVLAHANGFHAMVLGALAEELGAFLDCLAPDFRGHGGSGVRTDLDFDWAGFALDVLATVDLIPSLLGGPGPGAEGVVGFGHSAGASALLLAEVARPGTFAAIYCFEPILLPPALRRPTGAANPMSDAARRRRVEFGSREDALAHFRSRALFARFDERVLAAYVAHGVDEQPGGSARLRCLPEHEALVFAAGFASDAFDQLDQVRCPVRIAIGASSSGPARVGAELAAEQIPRCSCVELAGLGHLGPLESPALVGASVLEWIHDLERVEPPPGDRFRAE